MDRKLIEDPTWKKSINDIELPSRTAPYTDRELPKRHQDLIENVEPMFAKSSTERPEPRRAYPYTDKELPARK
jgi:hypothetical protein